MSVCSLCTTPFSFCLFTALCWNDTNIHRETWEWGKQKTVQSPSSSEHSLNQKQRQQLWNFPTYIDQLWHVRNTDDIGLMQKACSKTSGLNKRTTSFSIYRQNPVALWPSFSLWDSINSPYRKCGRLIVGPGFSTDFSVPLSLFKPKQSYFHLPHTTMQQQHKEGAVMLILATQGNAGVSTPEPPPPIFISRPPVSAPYSLLINTPFRASCKSHQSVCPDLALQLFRIQKNGRNWGWERRHWSHSPRAWIQD